jgi:fucose 4-O-acetylase-like acetyltransferase
MSTYKANYEKFDALKGIAIFLVVSIHFTYNLFPSGVTPALLQGYNYITMYAVPLFLVLGGYFFASKFIDRCNGISKKEFYYSISGIFRRIGVPYYISVAVLTCYNIIVDKDIYWKSFFFIDSHEHGLYFLIIYIYAFIFSFILCVISQKRLSKFSTVSMIATVSLFFFIITYSFESLLPDNIVFKQLPLISFFCFGIPLYFLQKILINYKINRIKIAFMLIIGIILFTLCLYILRKFFGPFAVFVNCPTTIYLLLYSLIVFLFLITILSYPLVLGVCKKAGFVNFGSNSLFIFLFHPYLVKVIVPNIVSVFEKNNMVLFSNAMFPVVLMLSYIVVYCSSKLCEAMPLQFQKVFSR